MKKARKIVSIIVTLCFLLTLVPVGAFAAPKDTETPFDDVQTTDWFYDTVQYVYDEGLMAGTGERIFSPQQTTTRGMIVTILHRMAGSPEAKAQDFTDVDPDAWYAPAINWSIESGVGAGYGGGLFGPDDAITREQMASFLYRYAELEGYDVSAVGDLDDFADASAVSDWAEDVMSWAVGADLFAGRDNNQLAPQGLTTRAEAATILMRYCENIVGTSAEDPSDEPSDEPSDDPDSPDVDDPSEDNPSVDPTPNDPEEPGDDGESGEIAYTAPERDHIQTASTESDEIINGEKYVDNQLIVLAKEDVDRTEIENIADNFSARIVGEIETIGLYQLELSEAKDLEKLGKIIDQLEALPQVEDSYFNTIEEIEGDTIPYFPSDNWTMGEDEESWDELYPGGNNWGVEAINAPSAWNLLSDQYGSVDAVPSVRVGVIDTYIDMKHPDLADNVEAVYWYQNGWKVMLPNQSDETAMNKAAEAGNYNDFTNIVHGTHVMGTIGATFDNNTGVSGVAINPELYGASMSENVGLVDMEYESFFGTATALANLIEDSKCKVINYSRGFKNNLDIGYTTKLANNKSKKVCEILKRYLRANYDFLIVTSAGNKEDRDASINSAFNNIEDEYVKSRIIVVGSSYINESNVSNLDDSTAYIYSGQCMGSRVDVLAPGVSIYSTVSKNPQTLISKEGTNTYTANSYYMTMTGTSMAAPHISGVAALVWAADPSLKGDQVKRIIEESAIIPVTKTSTDSNSANMTDKMVDAAYAVSLARDLDYTITGTCGDNMFWSLDPEGNLEIRGSGEMEWGQKSAPWQRYKASIKKIIVGDGITSIYKDAFTECSQVDGVELGKDIVKIGDRAFWMMPKLKDIKLPQDIKEIGEQAIGFDGTNIIDGFTIYGYAGTVAETYANDPGDESGKTIKFVDISSGGELIPPEDPDDGDDPETGDVPFAGGSGTEEDPYQVATAEQLNAVRYHLDANFVQVADISLAEYENWEPIGTTYDGHFDEEFRGEYDGGNYSILNLTISNLEKDIGPIIGLFGDISGTIKNVTLENVNFNLVSTTNMFAVGSVAGHSNYTLTNCHVLSGTVQYTIGFRNNIGLTYIGGVVGYGSAERCSNSVDILVNCIDNSVSSDSGHLECGGIVGKAAKDIKHCINYASISASVYDIVDCGGIVGSSVFYSIDCCVNFGDVHGNVSEYRVASSNGNCNVGGIVGECYGAFVNNSINYGNISADNKKEVTGNVGGIVGICIVTFDDTEGGINNSFNFSKMISSKTELDEGEIKHVDSAGRLIGRVMWNSTYDNIYSCNEVYSIDTLLNGQKATTECTTTERNGQTLSEEEMNKKIQYILEALGLDQTA